MTQEDRVRSLVATELHLHLEEVTLDTSFVDDLAADSFDTAALLSALESEFDCVFSDEEADSLKTPRDVILFLQQENQESCDVEAARA